MAEANDRLSEGGPDETERSGKGETVDGGDVEQPGAVAQAAVDETVAAVSAADGDGDGAAPKLSFLGASSGEEEALPEIDMASLKLFTLEELGEYDGVKTETIYIAAAGIVFEMTSEPGFYGPGAGYGLFAGHDATVNLARTSLKPETIDALAADVGLQQEQIECLEAWVTRYRQKYPIVGRIENNAEALSLTPVVATSDGTPDESDCVIS